jgi:hypothetical protein
LSRGGKARLLPPFPHMNHSRFEAPSWRMTTCGALALLFTLGLATAGSLFANITVGTDGARSFSPSFYGSNGQNRNDFDWQSPATNDYDESFAGTAQGSGNVLGSMNMGLLRFPAGTGANYWDWYSGKFLTFYSTDNADPSPLSELKNEVQESGAQPVYIVNLISDPNKNADDVVGGPTPTDGSSDAWTYQLSATSGIFANAYASDLALPYVELGNEIYSNNSDDTTVYPNPYVQAPLYYAPAANQWIWNVHGQTIYGQTSGPLVAACGADRSLKPADGRRQAWNWGTDGKNDQGLFSALNYNKGNQRNNADAVTIHIYPIPNLPATTSTPLSVTQSEELIGSVFINWPNILTDDFTAPYAIPTPVWVTEYNLDAAVPSGQVGATSVYHGSWAHGLALGAISLKWLEEGSIQMMIHHCVVANSAYADIFSGTDGLSDVGLSNLPATELYGISAGGMVSKYINTAAKGQTSARQLTFSGFGGSGSTYSVTDNIDGGSVSIPRLYGWEFTGAAGGDKAVILNLDSNSWTVSLGGIMSSVSAYYQLAAPKNNGGTLVPGVYVYDGKRHAAFDSTGGNELDLVYSSGSGTTIVLPPFSVTQLNFTP